MTSRVQLEPEAQAFAEAAAKTPFLFTLGPEKGRIALDEMQSGKVSKLPIDIEDLTIAELSVLVARIIGYTGHIAFDPSRPDGTPRKLLDLSRIHTLGWKGQIPLEQGIASTYQWYVTHASENVSA